VAYSNKIVKLPPYDVIAKLEAIA